MGTDSLRPLHRWGPLTEEALRDVGYEGDPNNARLTRIPMRYVPGAVQGDLMLYDSGRRTTTPRFPQRYLYNEFPESDFPVVARLPSNPGTCEETRVAPKMCSEEVFQSRGSSALGGTFGRRRPDATPSKLGAAPCTQSLPKVAGWDLLAPLSLVYSATMSGPSGASYYKLSPADRADLLDRTRLDSTDLESLSANALGIEQADLMVETSLAPLPCRRGGSELHHQRGRCARAHGG